MFKKVRLPRLFIVIVFLISLSLIFYFLFDNIMMFLFAYMFSSLLVSVYMDKIKQGKYIMYFIGLFYLMVNISMIFKLITNVLYDRWIFSIWFTLTIITIPYFLYKFMNRYIYSNTLLMNKLKPKDKNEIKREDSIIIDVVGFMQAIVTLTLIGENLKNYQITVLLGMFIFIIIRSYGIIKDSWKFRSFSTYVLGSIIIVDIIMYLNIYIIKLNQITILKDIINIPIELFIFTIMFYLMVLFAVLFDKMIENRYFH